MGRKCFISFKTEDIAFKLHIQNELNIDMIDKSLDEAIESDDEDYVLRRIREDYLSDSTVTLHLIGLASAENRGSFEQAYIKRELQASLYNGLGNTRNGILGIVLPSIDGSVYRGKYTCSMCGGEHNHIALNDNTVIREFSYNYYIPNGRCHHIESDRYCVLCRWADFCSAPEAWIESAFTKRSEPIADRTRVYVD